MRATILPALLPLFQRRRREPEPAPFPPILEDNTWEQINQAVSQGRVPDTWEIGSTKDIVVSGETLTLQIYGKNHDDLASGGKAGLTFGLKHLMATTRRMEETDTNVNSFSGSYMYAWLHNTLLPGMPADLQAVIKSVNKKTSAGGQSPTILVEPMKIFLLSEIEYRGTTSYSAPGEGEMYPVFTFSDNTSRIKHRSNGAGAAYYWWGRSPRLAVSTSFCRVLNDGTPSYYTAATSYGVCFAFCV